VVWESHLRQLQGTSWYFRQPQKSILYTHMYTPHHEPLFCTLTLSSSHCRSLLQPRRRPLSDSFRLSLSLCPSLFIPLFLLVITFLRKVESQGERPGSSLFEYVWFLSRGSNASQIAWVSLPSVSEAVLAELITSLITHALDLLRCLHSSLLSIFPQTFCLHSPLYFSPDKISGRS